MNFSGAHGNKSSFKGITKNLTLIITTTMDSSLEYLDVSDNFSDGLNTSSYIPYKERPETYVVPVLFFLIFVVGVVGNGTLVLIFLRHRNMRNVPNTYIFSLALADLLVIITSVPFTSVVYTFESWPWGELICRISETAKDISIGVSVFTLTALSADRFFAIVDPLKKFHIGGRRATRLTLCIAISIWILATICALPALFGSHIKSIYDEEGNCFEACYPFPEGWLGEMYPQVMVMSKFLILYVIPLAIIAVFYLTMAVYLILSTRNVPGEVQGMHRQIRARKKVAITVLAFVLVFAVCFAPLHTFMLFFYFHPKFNEMYDAFWHYFRIVGFCLCYMNSCANPVALYFISGAFRKHFNRYLFCINPQRSRCNTCHNQNATTMSLLSTKRSHSVHSRKSQNLSTSRKSPLATTPIQETSVTLLNNGNGHALVGNKL